MRDDVPLVFEDDEPQERPVTIRKEPYLLVEASAEAYRNYENARMAGMRWGGEDKPSYNEAAADCELALVQGCLFHQDKGGARHQVTMAEVKALRAHTIRELYRVARELSRLDERERAALAEAAEVGKNGTAATPEGDKAVAGEADRPKGSPAATGTA